VKIRIVKSNPLLKHKTEEMVDVVSKKCEDKGCEKIPCFGLEGDGIVRYCLKHKTDDMIDVKHKKCGSENCKIRPSYGAANDGIARHCLVHKTEEMVDVMSKQCEENGCKIQPAFGLEEDGIRRYCSDHKTEEMVDVVNKKCEEKGCEIHPSYGLKEDGIRRYCLVHKTEEMVDVTHKKCKTIENDISCSSRPDSRYDGYCATCFLRLFPGDKRSSYIRIKYKNESLCREIIEQITAKRFPKRRPLFLQGLEYDGYCEESKIAFEYQGKQHAEYVPYFHRNGEIDFHRQQERDALKKYLSLKNGIRLIEIWYHCGDKKSHILRELSLV
jgi:hypothetical protein